MTAGARRPPRPGQGPTFAHLIAGLAQVEDGGMTFARRDGSTRERSFAAMSQAAELTGRRLLATNLKPGDRLGLVIPDPETFITTFLGALRVGLVPVPLYPPLALGKLDNYIDVTGRMLRAAGARVLVVGKEVQRVLWSLVGGKEAPARDLYTLDSLPEPTGPAPSPDTVTPQDVAFLQFTSGSTDMPKGVRVTHAALMANSHAIMVDLLAASEDDRGVSWLPLYHDMGLIGFVLAPLLTRTPVVFLPTMDFVRQPSAWLQLISRFKGTITFAPNFAYALTARRTPDLAGLDLSSMRVFGCGAEPIQPQTMRDFVRHFAPAALRPEALLPCYGMAEATLAMTFADLTSPLEVDAIDREAFHGLRLARPAAPDAVNPLEFVCCGRPPPGHEVAIVAPDGRPLGERQVGEIVFRGPSVTGGYHENPEATAAAFRAEGLFTGDLGYLAGGQLYVTGRKKDILILNGRNHHPETLERAAAEVPGVRKGNVVAFTRPGTTTEEVVLACEVAADMAPDRQAELSTEIRKKVQAAVHVPVADVVLLGPGRLPKTSSGKLQRAKTREQYLDGSLGREGVRTVGQGGEKLVVARHVMRGLGHQVMHTVRRGAIAVGLTPIPDSDD